LATSTGIIGRGYYHYSASDYYRCGMGTAIQYYDGIWQLVTGSATATSGKWYLSWYTGTPLNTWTKQSDFESGSHTGSAGVNQDVYSPALAVLNGTMHLTYRDDGHDLRWQTYDGASWTDKGDVEVDIGLASTMIKDPVNDQLVCIYVNGAGDLVYRVTNNLTSWSDSHLIFTSGTSTIQYPHAEFIDGRISVSFSYNLRGNYNVYTISAPDYSTSTSGLETQYNRIQWPDAAPGDTNVNSTIFSLKNIDNRSIDTITWHFEDIGSITAASNVEVWTNMSGAWTSIGTCDASGNITILDISTLMAGGGEWIPGQTIYWKAEIQAIGSVVEDLHSTDEDIYYRITFAS